VKESTAVAEGWDCVFVNIKIGKNYLKFEYAFVA